MTRTAIAFSSVLLAPGMPSPQVAQERFGPTERAALFEDARAGWERVRAAITGRRCRVEISSPGRGWT